MCPATGGLDPVLPDVTGRYGEAISSHFGCEFTWPRQLTLLTPDQSSAAIIHIWASLPHDWKNGS
jgi:hypothetical protein